MTATQTAPRKNHASQPAVAFPNFAPWPQFDDEQIEAVSAVLRSGRINYWTGEEGRLFEKELAASVGVEHCVALANGTVALELALRALEIGPGDEVIVPCRTFMATASSVTMVGAKPVFADVNPFSQNITARTISAALTSKTKAIIVVHLAGWPCDMDPIMELAKEHGLKVIEDCAQAHGATYKGRVVGSIGDVGAFSFCQDKIITTGGEGGALVTNNHDVWEKAWSFKDHGRSWDAVYNRKHDTVFKWVHDGIGTNWRLTDLQAVLGRIGLKRLPEWLAARRRNAALLGRGLSKLDSLRLSTPKRGFEHSYYKFYAFLRPEKLATGWTRDRIVRELQAQGIPVGPGVCPEVYLERSFQQLGFYPKTRLGMARVLGETSLMFSVHPTLTPAEMHAICQATEQALHSATAEDAALRFAAA